MTLTSAAMTFVAHKDDGLACAAIVFLKDLGARTLILSGPDTTAFSTDIVFFTGQVAGGHRQAFPSKTLRKLILPDDVVQRGFIIPAYAEQAGVLYAIRPPTPGATHANLNEAIRQIFYLREGAWKGPKKKRASRRLDGGGFVRGTNRGDLMSL